MRPSPVELDVKLVQAIYRSRWAAECHCCTQPFFDCQLIRCDADDGKGEVSLCFDCAVYYTEWGEEAP